MQAIDGDDYAKLYQSVLCDLPIGEYFRRFLEEEAEAAKADAEMNIGYLAEIMKDYTLE